MGGWARWIRGTIPTGVGTGVSCPYGREGGGSKASDQWERTELEGGRERFMRNMRGIMPRHTIPKIQ
jgi:hypothetical protein